MLFNFLSIAVSVNINYRLLVDSGSIFAIQCSLLVFREDGRERVSAPAAAGGGHLGSALPEPVSIIDLVPLFILYHRILDPGQPYHAS